MISGLYGVFGKKEYKPFARIAVYLAMLFLIGGLTGSRRDMLLRELEVALDRWGTPYTFPPADQVTNNQDLIAAALAELGAVPALVPALDGADDTDYASGLGQIAGALGVAGLDDVTKLVEKLERTLHAGLGGLSADDAQDSPVLRSLADAIAAKGAPIVVG